MSQAINWSNHADALLLQLRAAGMPWHVVASQLQVGRNAAIDRARRLGLPPARRSLPAPRPVVERTDRPTLPPGHPASWMAITDGSPLAGAPYPFPVFL